MIRTLLGAAALLGMAGALTATACGAKSGLPVPDTVSEGAGGDAGVSCLPGIITLTKAQPTILFVIDRSGSMGGHLGKNSGSSSRWKILGSALAATLPEVDDKMAIGALIFPSSGFGAGGPTCAVPGAPDLAPGLGHVGLLLSLMQFTSPHGATPTAAAIDAASAQLQGVRAAKDARALVLATDGGPDCNESLDASTCRCANGGNGCKGHAGRCLDDARTEERIAAALADGLPTYVIGIQDEGDDTLTDVLDAMADAGGRPKLTGGSRYYAARSEGELTEALAVIRDQVGACVFLTSSVPDTNGSIEVTLNGGTLPFDPTGAEGWSWSDQENGEMVLHGKACMAAIAAGGAGLQAQVACQGP
ncbi:MAG: hypothetical protein U0359_02435 [Byssovorax sp.]